MKKNIYKCQRCSVEKVTADRDEGVTPMMIGCDTKGCGGMMISKMYRVDQNLDPELIFIQPKNKVEWQSVKDEVTKNIKTGNPNLGSIKVARTLNRVMNAIIEHVSKGGLVELPKDVVDGFLKTKKVPIFQFMCNESNEKIWIHAETKELAQKLFDEDCRHEFDDEAVIEVIELTEEQSKSQTVKCIEFEPGDAEYFETMSFYQYGLTFGEEKFGTLIAGTMWD